MALSNRFRIYCRVCEDDVTLQEVSVGDYKCIVCGTVYTDEDGVQDMDEAEYYAQLYAGEKRAGLHPEPEFKQEFENLAREDFHGN